MSSIASNVSAAAISPLCIMLVDCERYYSADQYDMWYYNDGQVDCAVLLRFVPERINKKGLMLCKQSQLQSYGCRQT